MTEKRFFLITAIALLYLTISLACDPLAYRLVSIFGMTIGGAGLIYSSLYTLLDVLTRLTGRAITIKLILIFHLCDFIFSYLLFGINLLPVPHSFHNLHAFNIVMSPIPRMFWAGIIGSIVAGIIEVFVYAFLQKRIKSFFVSSFLATVIILLAHNVPTDIVAYKKAFPNISMQIVATNFTMNCIFLVLFTSINSIVLRYFAGKNATAIPVGLSQA